MQYTSPSVDSHVGIPRSRFLFFSVLLLMLVAGACTPHKKLVYLQQRAEDADTLMFTRPDYRIKANDILYIQVLTLDEDSDAIFNTEGSRRFGTGGGGSSAMSVYLHGYTVSDEGKVRMPVLGDIQLAGMTIKEATAHIEENVTQYALGATVVVKLVNFSVTILGEVGSPGNYYIYDNQYTIMDAIAQAGDLGDYGNRNIRIVRQTAEGASFATLDITDARAITSEFYYLQPNDIIYVEPLKVKRLNFVQLPVSLALTALSTTLLIINLFGN